MTQRKRRRSWKMRLFFYAYALLILMMLCVVSSYTWFSLSRTPRVSDMYMFVNADTGLELSEIPGAVEWKRQLDFRDIVDVTTPLRPVTWSQRDQCFYAAGYSYDGRQTGTWEKLTDQRNANKNNLDGYYIKATFYARSGVAVDVSLSPAVEVDEGKQGSGTYLIGTPIWDKQAILHSNGGQGAECAVRIGIRTTPVDKTGVPTGEPSEFFIYEPNADMHIGGGRGYANTPSIDGSDALIDADHLIRQSSSVWTEAFPIQRNVVIRNLGDFLDEPYLFTLQAGQMVRIDLYVWLEGQDADCTNQITEAQILASIQFAGKTQGQSGLQPIV